MLECVTVRSGEVGRERDRERDKRETERQRERERERGWGVLNILKAVFCVCFE